MHEEMPQVRPEGIDGFQLWVNLPAKLKMSRPRYQGIKASEIPTVEVDGGVTIRVITGTVGGIEGPVKGIAADPSYLDITMPPETVFRREIPRGHTAFAYVFEGEAGFGGADPVSHTRLAVFGDGDYFEATTGAGQMIRETPRESVTTPSSDGWRAWHRLGS